MPVLWCYIEGQRDIFNVSISPECTVHDLKKQIYNEEHVQSIVHCTPSSLTITKVRYIMISMWNIEIMNGLIWLMTFAG